MNVPQNIFFDSFETDSKLNLRKPQPKKKKNGPLKAASEKKQINDDFAYKSK